MRLKDTNLIFVFGAARSGTTWLQLLLGSHAKIATTIEFPIYRRYVMPLWRIWNEEFTKFKINNKFNNTFNRGWVAFSVD